MGQWTPVVYNFSSNWKELKTLHLTLQHLRTGDLSQLKDAVIFYFTDNSTTYWIMTNGSSKSVELHKLIQSIRLLELEMNFQLVVIHVPGVVMILQRADGLSRGIWFSKLHESLSQQEITGSVFAPLSFDSQLVNRIVLTFDLPRQWTYIPWNGPWRPEALFNRFTIWFPPPEIARQVIIFVLETWVERPLTTSALFIVPRTLSHAWTGLSQHLDELGTWKPQDCDLTNPPLLPIPFVVLCLNTYTRVLPLDNRGVDSTPFPPERRWHRQQAADMRGLQPRPLQF
jgi:hypothetical protein